MTLGLLSLGLLTAACGGTPGGGGDDDTPEVDGGGGSIEGLASITVTPGDVTLIVEGGVAATQGYTAVGHFEDGSERDLTAEVRFDLDERALGRFAGAQLTTTVLRGGRTSVRATAGGVSGLAALTVQLRERYRDPAAGSELPDDVEDRFGGTDDPGRGPELVYPADGVLVPPNLGQLEVHFRPGAGNTLFALAFASDTADVIVYTTCVRPLNGGCIYTPDPEVWRWIADSNRGGGITVSVRGADAAGTAVGTSADVAVAFSQDDIQGGIYYWTTSGVGASATAIVRFDFGRRDQLVAEAFLGTSMTNGRCVGCHVLSRAGDKLVTATDGSYNAFTLLLDVGRRQALVPYASTPPSAFSSWSPTGDQFVGVFANANAPGFLSYDLNLFDGNTGVAAGTVAVGGTEAAPANHPDWSPQGDRIVYTQVGSRDGDSLAQKVFENRLRVVSRTGDTWGTPVDLTARAAGASAYYPTFSPDGDLVVFNRSACAGGANGDDCDCYDDPGAALWAIAPEAGATAVELTRANAPGVADDRATVQSSYPKWSPFTFRRTSELGSRLHWVTFSSDRAYGLYEPDDDQTLIWMAGVDPDTGLAGNDPSFPAFALPFQDLTTDNHTAQWTERIITID